MLFWDAAFATSAVLLLTVSSSLLLLFLVHDENWHLAKFNVSTAHELRTFDGSFACPQPVQIEQPADMPELQRLVMRASMRGQNVRVVGAGYSWTPSMCTQDVLVNLDKLNNVLDASRESLTVWAEAGIRMSELNEKLRMEDMLCLKVQGVADAVSLGGALAMGTHGNSQYFGNVAKYVGELDVMLSNGTIARVSPKQRREVFTAALSSMGSVGIIVRVKMRITVDVLLRRREVYRPMEHVLDSLEDILEGNRHVHVEWQPHQGGAKVITANKLPISRRKGSLDLVRTPYLRWIHEEFVPRVVSVVLSATADMPDLWETVDRYIVSPLTMGTRDFIDYNALAQNGPYLDSWSEMEYSVPLAQVVNATRALQKLFEENPDFKLNMPILITAVEHDSVWLSPQYDRDSAVFTLRVYKNPAMMERIGRAFGHLLATEFDGRPHWGKLHFESHEAVRSKYPEFGTFLKVRAANDPFDTFLNDHLYEVFGIEKTARGWDAKKAKDAKAQEEQDEQQEETQNAAAAPDNSR